MFTAHVATLSEALAGLGEQSAEMEAAAAAIADSLHGGGKVLAAGNGGSAAEAQHFTAELLGRLRPDRDRAPLAAVALHADTSTLTAAGNDYGYDEVFARQVRGLGRAGDVFLGLSTSATSANVVRAARAARELGMVTIALVGARQGPLHDVSDHVLAVPSTQIGAIQEAHLVLVHVLVERAEDLLFGPDWSTD
nr:SIS domain-containing protein [Salsipaludibacter albus]